MKTTTIGESCTLHARIGWQGLTKSEYLDEGDYYLITGVDFDNGHIAFENCHYVTKDRYDQDQHIQIHSNDVLVTKDGTIGKVAFIDKTPNKPATLNSGVFVVRPKNPEMLLPQYLVVVLLSNHFTRFIDQIKVGCTIAHLNQEKFLKFSFPYPSIDQQLYIIKIYNTMMRLILKRKQQLLTFDTLIKARFVEMFGMPGTDEHGWGLSLLGDCCEINPKKGLDSRLTANLKVSFVPMPAVTENGKIDVSETKTYDEVKNGFTYFAENDVLFAKITPCMENGKGAVAVGLTNGIGFGSTEFHVLWPIISMSNPYWLYTLMAFETFRKDAAANMTGSAGQRRVPVTFLERFKVALPPIQFQRQFADFVSQIDKSKSVVQKALDEARLLFDSLMQQYFG